MNPITTAVIEDLGQLLLSQTLAAIAQNSALSFLTGGILNPITSYILGKLFGFILTETALGISWVVVHVEIAQTDSTYIGLANTNTQVQSDPNSTAAQKAAAAQAKLAAFLQFATITGKGL